MAAPSCTRVDLKLGDDWVTVNDRVYDRDRVSISRGRRDETGRTDPSTCDLTLRNDDREFSARNPESENFGLLGRNTPLRAGVNAGSTFLRTTLDGRASTPDDASLDITGDIDIRIEFRLKPAARAGAIWELAGKYEITGNQRSWRLLVAEFSDDLIGNFGWSEDGTSTILQASSSRLPSTPTGWLALRFTLDVNNGAGGKTARWYTADTIAGPWTQHGSDITTAGTTNIFAGSGTLDVAGLTDLLSSSLEGEVRAFELRDGIDGPVVAAPDFTVLTDGDTSFVDSEGLTWTVAGDAEITDLRWRFHGEVPAWPQQWDDREQALRVPITAAGPTRRLGQGQAPVQSTLKQGTLDAAEALVAYWPCEDQAGSLRLASALDDASPINIVGSPDLASFDEFDASAPIPVLKDSQWTGRIPAYDDTGEVQLRFLLHVSDSGSVDGEGIIQIFTAGSIPRWDVRYIAANGGGVQLRGYDAEGNELFQSLQVEADGMNGELHQISVELRQDGGSVAWLLGEIQPGTGGTFDSGSESGTVGRAKRVAVNPGGGHDDVAIGHIRVQAAQTSFFDTFEQLNAYIGEVAGRRFQRLCVENDIAFQHVGDLDATAAMGAQLPHTLLDLLWECVDTDLGILYEPRDMLGLGYRTRESLYNQTPVVELDCCADPPDLAGPLGPVEDDRTTRNDVTVTRQGGSSARAVKTSGALSTAPPPEGVGIYDGSVTVNVESDLDLPDQAGWRLHLGTVDEPRFPNIELELLNPAVADRVDELLLLDAGNRMLMSCAPSTVAPGDVDVLVQGYTEEFSDLIDRRYRLRFTGAPASPWDVAVDADLDAGGDDEPDGPYARFGPLNTVLAENLDTTETGVTIDPGVGTWTTDSDHFPFEIVVGGETMQATGNTGTTLTVVRSVNGVVKTHDTGDPVRLAHPAIRPL